MEIPGDLKTLYKHWDKHSKSQHSTLPGEISLNNNIFREVEVFIKERMLIWERREVGESVPFTEDVILRDYRFCNIYRELDRQTIEIHEMLKVYQENFKLWLLNAAFCRYICNTKTIKTIGLLSFNERENRKVYENLMNLSSPKYGTAYIFPISTIMRSDYETREKFFCLYLPEIIPAIADEILRFNEISVCDSLARILPKFGFNHKFHWTEILIDLAYQYPQHIDLFKTFPIGPGALPTMKRLNPDELPEKVCLIASSQQPLKDFPYLTYNGKTISLSAENWEGIGCEFRKYSNLKTGKGRKRRYKMTNI